MTTTRINQMGLIEFSRSTILEDVQPSRTTDPDAGEPPRFVRLASHPLRWRLLRELVRSDRTVREYATEIWGIAPVPV